MPTAAKMPFTNQTLDVVTAMAAVAFLPNAPTMAVLMYCTNVMRNCSSIVGHARYQITRSGLRFSSRKSYCICYTSTKISLAFRF